MSHTPGPWCADKEDYGWGILTVEGATQYLVARLPFDECDGNLKANARLIAACPTMYEALRSVKDHFDYLTTETKRAWKASDQAVYERVSAAIAKAEGRT